MTQPEKDKEKRPQCHECHHERKEHRPMAHSHLHWCPECYRRCARLFPPDPGPAGSMVVGW